MAQEGGEWTSLSQVEERGQGTLGALAMIRFLLVFPRGFSNFLSKMVL
jgi:hypothetical protein